MVAHELGHCLGLGHPEPRCTVFADAASGSLMQQQRVFALQAWAPSCSCLRPTCGDCGCNMTDAMYAQFASARALDAEERTKAHRSGRARDRTETAAASHVTRIGVSVNQATDMHDGVLLDGSAGQLLLATAPFNGSVTAVRLRAVFASPPLPIDAEVQVMRGFDCRHKGAVVDRQRVSLDGVRFRAHWALAGLALAVQQGDGVVLALRDKRRGARVRVAAVPSADAEVCVLAADGNARSAQALAHVDFVHTNDHQGGSVSM